MQETIILPVVLYGCKFDHQSGGTLLRMCENTTLRKIKDNEEHNLFSLPNNVRAIIKNYEVNGTCSTHVENVNIYNFAVSSAKGTTC
jgi:hypothetical protein